MGIIRLGPPRELMLFLKEQFLLTSFVETGTYLGETSVWAAANFQKVITIENARSLYDQVVEKHGHTPNLEFRFGDSKDVLKEVVPTLDSPTLFWLDGHWSGGSTYGEFDQCPILDEIRAVNASPLDHFLFIDDARQFAAPPPKPLRIEEWPPIDKVIEEIKASPREKYIVLFEDVIIAVPISAQKALAEWVQEANTKSWDAWERQARQKKPGRMRQGFSLIGQGLHLLGESIVGRAKRMSAR